MSRTTTSQTSISFWGGGTEPPFRANLLLGEPPSWKLPETWQAKTLTVELAGNMTARNQHVGNCSYVAGGSRAAGSSRNAAGENLDGASCPKQGGRSP